VDRQIVETELRGLSSKVWSVVELFGAGKAFTKVHMVLMNQTTGEAERAGAGDHSL
jgi:hypothetical protein